MLTTAPALPRARQAGSAAANAARTAGVTIVDETDMDRLRDASALLVSVWGFPAGEGPIPAELLRGISHAGCAVTVATDSSGVLCGVAVLVVSPGATSAYSLIAGVLPDAADRGVGFALKQHQRAWALARGIETITWTFDPLVSRNARFNLTKLGAHAAEYTPNFYGAMHGAINANDESDRLSAHWSLNSEAALACSEGRPESVELPRFMADQVRVVGPDGQPALIDVNGTLWCRVPDDIVALRRRDPELAAEWRRCVRTIFTRYLAEGHVARGVTRAGWYRLATGGQ